MIRRPPRSTRVRSSAASDVYKRQTVQRVEIGDTHAEEAMRVDELQYENLLALQLGIGRHCTAGRNFWQGRKSALDAAVRFLMCAIGQRRQRIEIIAPFSG